MRRSTTSVVTERRRSSACFCSPSWSPPRVLLAHPFAATRPAAGAARRHPRVARRADRADGPADAARRPHRLADGARGSRRPPTSRRRIWAELDGAADAVTAFWGDDWPRNVVRRADRHRRGVPRAGAPAGPTSRPRRRPQRIVFAPGASTMSDASLRIVLRHELFHYAARSRTAADAPRWLTEGVADYVGRPPTPMPTAAARRRSWRTFPPTPTSTPPGAVRSLAYDRAWWFSRFVAEPLRRADACARCTSPRAARATPTRARPSSSVLGADTAAGAGRVARLARADSVARWPESCW